MLVGTLLFVLTGLFPPWEHTFRDSAGDVIEPAGYGFLMAPPDAGPPDRVKYNPEKYRSIREYWGIRLDIVRLFVQWMIILVATICGLILTHDKRKGEHTDG